MKLEAFLREADTRLAGSEAGQGSEVARQSARVSCRRRVGIRQETCTVIQSGTEPDLLAGQVFQDNNNIRIPTRPVNLWLAKTSVLVEAGGKLLTEPERWRHLVQGGLRSSQRRFSLFGGKPAAPRAIILCVEADQFLNPSEDARAANTRALQERLGDIAQILGVSLPVYAVVTKLDRIPCFSEFCANLAKEEISQVLGVTLPFFTGSERGVYAERQSRRLTFAFDNLAASLCDKRLAFFLRATTIQSGGPAVLRIPTRVQDIAQSAGQLPGRRVPAEPIARVSRAAGLLFFGRAADRGAGIVAAAEAGFTGGAGGASDWALFSVAGASNGGGSRVVRLRRIPGNGCSSDTCSTT